MRGGSATASTASRDATLGVVPWNHNSEGTGWHEQRRPPRISEPWGVLWSETLAIRQLCGRSPYDLRLPPVQDRAQSGHELAHAT